MSAIVRGLVHVYAEVKSRDKVDSSLLEMIDLDMAVDKLYKDNRLTGIECTTLSVASLGHSINSGSAYLSMSRWVYSMKLRSACRKMAGVLGWEYSNASTLRAVNRRLGRELTEEELKGVRNLFKIYAPNRVSTGVFDES